MIRQVLLQLMRKDLTQFWRIYPSKFFDTCLLFFTNAIVFGYFLTFLGVPSTYGSFMLVGSIASFGLFDIIGQVGELIVDIEGDKTITYSLSMPVPSWAIFGQIALKWAINTLLLFIPLFFLGKLVLWNQFDLTKVNVFQTILFFPTICLFFGFFSLWLTGMIKKIQSISSLFFRFINPIFMFGGYFFPWQDAFKLSPVIGYVLLFNPMMHVMEGLRAACLGQEGYLPFWASFSVLWVFIVVLGTHAIVRLKNRLDCV